MEDDFALQKPEFSKSLRERVRSVVLAAADARGREGTGQSSRLILL